MKRNLINFIELLMDLKESGIEVEFTVKSNYIEGKVFFYEIWRFDYYLTEDDFKCFKHDLYMRQLDYKAVLENEMQLAL